MWGSRKDAFVEYINKQEASVICMQEVTERQATFIKPAIEKKYDFVNYYCDEKYNPGGLGVAYDKKVWKKVSESVFWLSETPEEMSKGWDGSHYRICVNVLLEHKTTGAKLNVSNVHLDVASATARTNGIALVLERIEASEYPVFLCGDFNCRIDSEPYNLAAATLQDCQAVAPETDNGVTYQNWGKIADDSNTPIDFCFVSKQSMQPLSFKICRDKWGENNENFYSDHYAIQTTVRMSL